MDKGRIVLAYSGGLDTSAAIAWLAEQYSAEVSSPPEYARTMRPLSMVTPSPIARAAA